MAVLVVRLPGHPFFLAVVLVVRLLAVLVRLLLGRLFFLVELVARLPVRLTFLVAERLVSSSRLPVRQSFLVERCVSLPVRPYVLLAVQRLVSLSRLPVRPFFLAVR